MHRRTYTRARTYRRRTRARREKRKPTHVRRLNPDEQNRSLVPGALCSACTPYSARGGGDSGGRGTGDSGPKGSNAFERACVCLHNIRPYATCPSHTYHCLPLPSFLPLSPCLTLVSSSLLFFFFFCLRVPLSLFLFLQRGFFLVVDPHPRLNARERCLAVPLAARRPQGRVTLAWFAGRIRIRRWKEERRLRRASEEGTRGENEARAPRRRTVGRREAGRERILSWDRLVGWVDGWLGE